MQSDELELVICRFCGISPKLNLEYSVDNCKCLHSLEIFGLSRNIIYDAQETNLKKIVMLFKELWSARNEKHNPFLEGK